MTTEYEMVGWHHQLNGPKFEQALGDGMKQGSLVCYSPWGAESDMTEQLNSNKRIVFFMFIHKHLFVTDLFCSRYIVQA